MSDPFAHQNRARSRLGGIWIGQAGRLSCPACRNPFASAADRTARILAGEAGSEERTWSEEREALVGARVQLDAGYVNATTRHSSGARWYRPGKNRASPAPVLRLPAVVTCTCGREVGLSLSDDAVTMARATRKARVERLTELLIAEAGDQWTQRQVDLERGK